MTTFTAIDPGARTGIAWFRLGVLERVEQCGDVSVDCYPIVVVECPEYQKGRRVSPNDLITLARRVGRWEARIEAAGGQCVLVRPSEWKGQVPKNIHHQRIVNKLMPGEIAVIPRFAGMDAFDAIGLGLWYLKRL